jgi:hypothetical protein
VRQLNLFKSNRQRGTKPPPPLEFSNHVVLADILRRWCNPAWRWTHIASGESREHRVNSKGQRYSPTGNRLKRLGVHKGWPDLVFCGPERRSAWLELKRKRLGRISDEQDEIGEHLKANGFDYLVTDDVGEAVRFLQHLDILPDKIKDVV